MSISILEDNWAIEKYIVKLAELEKYLFATSLMGATIQDGGKRERSDTWVLSWEAENCLKTKIFIKL